MEYRSNKPAVSGVGVARRIATSVDDVGIMIEIPLDCDIVFKCRPRCVDVAVELNSMVRIICGLYAGGEVAKWDTCPA